MRSRQRGATFLGMVVILAILGFALYAGIRLVPVYLEYMAVARALEQTAKETCDGRPARSSCAMSLDRRWTRGHPQHQPKDIEIKKAGSGFTMRAWYAPRRRSSATFRWSSSSTRPSTSAADD